MDPEAAALLARLGPALAGEPAVLVTVLQVRGSAPRAVGARMLVRHGRLRAGTVGGGHLEWQALARAAAWQARWQQARAAGADPSTLCAAEELVLGEALAQCCGGVVVLGWQWVEPTAGPAGAQDAAAGAPLTGATAGARVAGSSVTAAGVWHTELGPYTLRERAAAPWTVLICGAGHVGGVLAMVLSHLPWRVVLCDGRPDAVGLAAQPPAVEVRRVEPAALLRAWGWPLAWGEASAAPAADRTMAVVMTHDHGLDRTLAAALLAARGRDGAPLRWVGLIGSKTKIASARQRLHDSVPAEDLARLVAPIGIRGADGALVGGKLPAEIAIAVAAQLVDVAARSATP